MAIISINSINSSYYNNSKYVKDSKISNLSCLQFGNTNINGESKINEDGELEINVSETTYWSPAAQTNSKTHVSGIKGDVDGDYAEKEFYDALIRLAEEKQEIIEKNVKRNR